MDAPPEIHPASISDMCFVQALFVHRCLRLEEARRIAIDIYGTDNIDVFSGAIERVANRLHQLNMTVKRLKHFNDGEKYMAIVNTVEDKSAKISSKYNFAQLQFFNHIVEMIASIEGETPGVCSVGINEAMNVDVSKSTQLSQNVPKNLNYSCLDLISDELLESGQVKLSMQQKEDTLELLKQDMWLGGDENELYIGARTFMELKNHLFSLDLPEETEKAWSEAL